ncbi:hypothetical protein PIB30_067681 [Stylosanthes scabra]|uniref:Uncharacterized protein n=1 Tax=Stylosanthes scabra TaxID=79078 RepID=A0ABU6SMS8_9FABA|nr:hypothetical protein [Stylosanthes scabra]
MRGRIGLQRGKALARKCKIPILPFIKNHSAVKLRMQFMGVAYTNLSRELSGNLQRMKLRTHYNLVWTASSS